MYRVWRFLGLVILIALVATAGAATLTRPVLADSWTSAGGLPALHGRIWSVAFDPSTPSNALAGTDSGIFRSTDGGSSWHTTSLTNARVWSVGFDVRNSQHAFAGMDRAGVRRSDDGGQTWSDASSGLPTKANVRSLAFGVDAIAAGTDAGVDVSTDGMTWQHEGLDTVAISSLTIAANSPTFTIVAGADGGDTSSGFLFRNLNGGSQWEALQNGLPPPNSQVAKDSHPTIVAWVAAGPLPPGAQKRPLIATTNADTYHSSDGGTTWSKSNGLPDQFTLTTATFSPSNPSLLYAGSDGGGGSGGDMLRSTDGGTTFNGFHDGLSSDQRDLSSIAVSTDVPPVVLAAINSPGKSSFIARQVDNSAPVGSQVAETGASLPTATPTPSPTPHSHATGSPHHTTPPSGPEPGWRRAIDTVVRWPYPLSVELVAIIAVAYIIVRWRQRYLDVEGPPNFRH